MDIIERAAEYKTRVGPNSDSEQDEDNESINGSDQWEYPTVKNPTVVVRNSQPQRQHSIPISGEGPSSSGTS
jgi:hypothetical protein